MDYSFKFSKIISEFSKTCLIFRSFTHQPLGIYHSCIYSQYRTVLYVFLSTHRFPNVALNLVAFHASVFTHFAPLLQLTCQPTYGALKYIRTIHPSPASRTTRSTSPQFPTAALQERDKTFIPSQHTEQPSFIPFTTFSSYSPQFVYPPPSAHFFRHFATPHRVPFHSQRLSISRFGPNFHESPYNSSFPTILYCPMFLKFHRALPSTNNPKKLD